MNLQTSETGTLAIDICLCTFRRDHVAATLRSLAQLTVKPEWAVRVIVVDNDETPSARARVEAAAREGNLALEYIHAPARNIALARNACLAAAKAPYLAFIDDDELASPAWLAALLEAAQKSGADVVLGPVAAHYEPDYAGWMRHGDFHSIKPTWVMGEIVTGYTCNALIRRAAIRDLRFREELGRSGGEDTVFFSALHKAGGKFAFAPDAVVTEAVPLARANFSWLLRRFFRSGQTHALLLLEKDGDGIGMRLGNILVAGAKCIFCLAMVLLTMINPVRARFWILRGSLHAGVVARLMGLREQEIYG